jgi:hypothetical protein
MRMSSFGHFIGFVGLESCLGSLLCPDFPLLCQFLALSVSPCYHLAGLNSGSEISSVISSKTTCTGIVALSRLKATLPVVFSLSASLIRRWQRYSWKLHWYHLRWSWPLRQDRGISFCPSALPTSTVHLADHRVQGFAYQN